MAQRTRYAGHTSIVFCALILLSGAPLHEMPASSALWAAPAILLAAMLIAWAAESAQFFVAQGFALAILAWLQTLPEFAVEFVYAWRQEVPYLLANLTGALRLLTGLGWPMIYFVAAFFYRRRYRKPLRQITLQDGHCVEVVGLLVPLLYMVLVWYRGSLNLFDAAVLILIYAAYLIVLSRMPPEEAEGIEDLELIPRMIVTSPRPRRIALITGLFVGGRPAHLLLRGTVRGQPAGGFGGDRCAGVRFRAMGGAVRFGIPGESLGLLLGPHHTPRSHGADEHGVEQHQPVDPAGGHAAHRVLHQPGQRFRHPLRRSAEARTAHDAGAIAGRDALSVEHAAGVVGGGVALFPVADSIRVLPRQTRTGVCRLHGDAHSLVRHRRLSGVVHGGGALLSGEAAKPGGLPVVRRHVAAVRVAVLGPCGKIEEALNMKNRVRSTTVLCVRRNGQVVMAGDGQVTFGQEVLKASARKLRRFYNEKILAGFAGSTADAFALSGRFEGKLEQYGGNLARSVVELAKEWRMDRALRHLEALLLVADATSTYIVSGNGDVIEPDEGVAAIGSGGPFAKAAAVALMDNTELSARLIAEKAMAIASKICIYTNDTVTYEELG